MKTSPISWLGQRRIGYWVATKFSKENREKISEIQRELAEAYGEIFQPQKTADIHVTLLHWISPLVEYRRDGEGLLQERRARLEEVFVRLIAELPPLEVRFSEVRVNPDAVILVGEDDGGFQRLRSRFTAEAPVPEGTPPPPQIIHSTLGRFVSEDVVEELNISFEPFQERFGEFQLIYLNGVLLEDEKVVKTYRVGGTNA